MITSKQAIPTVAYSDKEMTACLAEVARESAVELELFKEFHDPLGCNRIIPRKET